MFETPLYIRFADVDILGHVNNACYISYIEQARIDFFDHHLPTHDWKNAGIILARTEIDYLSPLHLKDQIKATVFCNRIGKTSFDLVYQIMRLSPQPKIVAKAKTIMVCYDYIRETSIEVPKHWKTFLNPQNHA